MKRLGNQQSFVSAYEAGQRRVNVTKLLLIAEAVGVDSRKVLPNILVQCAKWRHWPSRLDPNNWESSRAECHGVQRKILENNALTPDLTPDRGATYNTRCKGAVAIAFRACQANFSGLRIYQAAGIVHALGAASSPTRCDSLREAIHHCAPGKRERRAGRERGRNMGKQADKDAGVSRERSLDASGRAPEQSLAMVALPKLSSDQRNYVKRLIKCEGSVDPRKVVGGPK